MNHNKNYFRQIIDLSEAIGMAGTEEVVPQEEIADSGSDVLPENEIEEQPEEEMEAPLQDNTVEMQSADSIITSQKLLSVYKLFEKIIDYGVTFIDALESVDTGLLDSERLSIFLKYIRNTKELIDKANNYMSEIFSKESYEKVLYTYILFRTELITNVKGIRDILRLQEPDEDLKHKSGK